MKKFIAFLKKEFLHVLRDRRTLLILFGIPIVEILLFGFAITNEIKDAKIAILDNSKDHVTKEIISKILSSGYFQLYENLSNNEEIESGFRKGKIKQVIVFESNFAQKLEKEKKANVQVIGDASDPNTANTLVNFTSAIINTYLMDYNRLKQQPVTIVSELKMLYNPELKGVFMFVPGVITIILMLVSAMMTSISITREKELGTMEVLMVSPLKPIQIISGKVLPYLILSFINAVVILLLGSFIFGMPVKGSIVLLLAECMLFIATALSLGIVISTVAGSQQTAMMISMMGLMLPTMMLSGFIFPIESMPLPLQWLSCIFPARWFIHMIKDIMIKGVELQFVIKDTLILLGMAVFFIGVSVKKFKLRLE